MGPSEEPPEFGSKRKAEIEYVGPSSKVGRPPLFECLDDIPSLLADFDPLAWLFVLGLLLLLTLIAVFALLHLFPPT